MKVLFFGTYDTKTTPRVQVLIEGLREHGVEVIECNSPLPLSTANRIAILRQPWRLPLLFFRITQCWITLMLKARRLPECDAVIIGHLGQFDIHLAKILFRHTPVALDYMVSGSEAALDRRLNSSWKDKLLLRIDNAALKSADIVIVDTEEHKLALPKAYLDKGIVVIVGAPQDWFDSAIEPGLKKATTLEKPVRIIFFGTYTPLQGASTIGKALSELNSPVEVTMIGTGQDREEAEHAATDVNKQVRITWVDWAESNKLPKLVAEHDICLGVFGTGPKSYKVVPNKVYQGAATGCVIVTADTPPQRRVLGDLASYIPAGDHKALAQELNRLANNPAVIERLREATFNHAREYFMPEQVVIPLLDKLTISVSSTRIK